MNMLKIFQWYRWILNEVDEFEFILVRLLEQSKSKWKSMEKMKKFDCYHFLKEDAQFVSLGGACQFL
jgi:hypothetical protein